MPWPSLTLLKSNSVRSFSFSSEALRVCPTTSFFAPCLTFLTPLALSSYVQSFPTPEEVPWEWNFLYVQWHLAPDFTQNGCWQIPVYYFFTMFVVWPPATILSSFKLETTHNLVGNALREVRNSRLFAFTPTHLRVSETGLFEQKSSGFLIFFFNYFQPLNFTSNYADTVSLLRLGFYQRNNYFNLLSFYSQIISQTGYVMKHKSNS